MALRMAVSTSPWTRRDLQRLPDDGNRYEVIRGRLFVTPLQRPDHEGIVIALTRRLREFVDAHGLGVVSERSAFVVLDDEAQPDIVVRKDPRPRSNDWKDLPPPILIVEVLSDTTARRDQSWKRSFYTDSGIPEYWIVDGDARAITVVRPGQPDVVHADQVSWSPPNCPASLRIDLAALFHEALDS